MNEYEDTAIMHESSKVQEKSARGRLTASQTGAHAQRQIGKTRHLKKDDGEPLWRVDIQYDFLKAVFDNKQKVFTNSYDAGRGKQSFADLYIDTISRSSKTSKVLRHKLLSDRDAAKGTAMVCLLVNVGRMNTTLNFFPEMRARLRTYHAIPSLQVHQDANTNKQLQDAPRIKSILKSSAEDREEPNSLEKIRKADVPRTNPANLIFSMCREGQKVAELHFPSHQTFHDLIMNTQYTSKSRAMAFLWLTWFYLESDFTEEGCEENPFGAGVDYGLDVANQGVPELIQMSNEERAKENVDTPEEIEFGREKQKVRGKILETDQTHQDDTETKHGQHGEMDGDGLAVLPRIMSSYHHYLDRENGSSTPPRSTLGRTGRRGSRLKQIVEWPSPARHRFEGIASRQPRTSTAHQLAVERNRHERVEYFLDHGLRRQHRMSRKRRRQEGAIFRTYRKIHDQGNPLEDSDDENATPCNVANNGSYLLFSEPDDYGEEASAYATALRRSTRRLRRWLGREDELGVVAPVKKPKLKYDAKDGDKTSEVVDDADIKEGN